MLVCHTLVNVIIYGFYKYFEHLLLSRYSSCCTALYSIRVVCFDIYKFIQNTGRKKYQVTEIPGRYLVKIIIEIHEGKKVSGW